ncbi:CBO0543 family protein [Neobacillus bataviensis]|uniref:CBO0543 family protein n=1 Tax=Neobacillus bataviensis TaxID=220685 RepID=UPI001CBB1683|nr:CBO0543 family protein [Neobacillus bataviensis]
MNLNVIYGAIFIFSAIKWGDWKNWEAYYPTFLFLMVGDLVYQFLFFKHSMWEYVPIGSDKSWAKHTHIAFLVMLIKYPVTISIFLGHMPKTAWKKIINILAWTLIYTINEYTDLKLGALIHKNGWNLWWSAFFSFVMFSVLAVHFKKPWLAWILSAIYATFLWNIFNVSQDILK